MQYKIICRTDKLNKNGEAPLVGSTLTNSFVEKNITYDKNTNLLTLKRYNNGTLTDDLSFSYLGSRRVGYNCDLNGNITNDATENLQVSYNFLNLPTAISQNSEVKARYSYAADSTKLGVVDASGVGYDYRGSFKYVRNGSSIELESVASAGGRTYKTDSGYEVRYFITDHLGSVRAVVNADGEIVEQNDYMPYGTLHANPALQKTDNRYLYGGKELQTDFGVNYYDSFARFQRTDGAFNSIDPLAEKYYSISPYAYCAGNPVNLVDIDGKDIIIIAFPDYKISTPVGKLPHLGHAGILLIDNNTGLTKYYEYGRYDNEKLGEVRNVPIPNVEIDDNGLPTKESLNKVMNTISTSAGQGGRVEGAYIKSAYFDKMNEYVQKKKNDNDNPDRKRYHLIKNNCGTFARDIVKCDQSIDVPYIIDPRPVSFVEEYQKKFQDVRWDNKNGLTIEE